MIEGRVNEDFGIEIPLTLIGADKQPVAITVTLDTGFDDRLALPIALILRLGMPYLIPAGVTVAGNTGLESAYYGGTILWDGEQKTIPVLSIEGKPLMGMLLFRGYELRFVSEVGEIVTLRKPRPRRTFRGHTAADAPD